MGIEMKRVMSIFLCMYVSICPAVSIFGDSEDNIINEEEYKEVIAKGLPVYRIDGDYIGNTFNKRESILSIGYFQNGFIECMYGLNDKLTIGLGSLIEEWILTGNYSITSTPIASSISVKRWLVSDYRANNGMRHHFSIAYNATYQIIDNYGIHASFYYNGSDYKGEIREVFTNARIGFHKYIFRNILISYATRRYDYSPNYNNDLESAISNGAFTLRINLGNNTVVYATTNGHPTNYAIEGRGRF